MLGVVKGRGAPKWLVSVSLVQLCMEHTKQGIFMVSFCAFVPHRSENKTASSFHAFYNPGNKRPQRSKHV